MTATLKLSAHDERRVAVQAGCDPRTVRAYLNGKTFRTPALPSRITEALATLGFQTEAAPNAVKS